MMRRTLVFLLALLCPLLASASPLRVALSVSGAGREWNAAARSLDAALSKELRRPVRTTPFVNVDAAVYALEHGEAELAWVPAFAWLELREKLAVRPVVRGLRGGREHHRSVIFVRADSALRSLRDLNGQRAVWAGLDSSAGYIVPRAMLRAAGVNPVSESMSGSPAGVCRAVWQKSADFGATWTAAEGVDGCRRELGESVGALRALAFSAPIPNDVLVAHPSLDPALVEKLVVLLQKEKVRAAFAEATGTERLVPALDEDLEPLRQLLEPGP